MQYFLISVCNCNGASLNICFTRDQAPLNKILIVLKSNVKKIRIVSSYELLQSLRLFTLNLELDN